MKDFLDALSFFLPIIQAGFLGGLLGILSGVIAAYIARLAMAPFWVIRVSYYVLFWLFFVGFTGLALLAPAEYRVLMDFLTQ